MTTDEQLISLITSKGNCANLYYDELDYSCDDCVFTDRCIEEFNLSNHNWDQRLVDSAVLRAACKLYLELNPECEDLIFEVLL